MVCGHTSGIYRDWFGEGGAREQVENYPGAIYKGFHSQEEMIQWLREFDAETLQRTAPSLYKLVSESTVESLPDADARDIAAGKVIIYTDGGALGNPGPGGYGVVLKYKKNRRELSGGFRKTTNNRMEIMACIAGLRALKKQSEVIVYSDSKYVVDNISKGFVNRWKANGWMRSKGHRAENADLWEQLLELCDSHHVDFRWVRGHSVNAENERCDLLATKAAQKENLPADTAFETSDPCNSLPLFSSNNSQPKG